MKILSIRLHPFGAIVDRSAELHHGLNVLEGPNEFGKSTLTHALWHALLTPTNLTPKNLEKTMGRWYPMPSGDHARVAVNFEAGGRIWTLEKTWGAGKLSSSRLAADGGAAIADAGAVQQKLGELLRLNEATWRHVLFTQQAELNRTVERLGSNAGSLDDVHALLAGAGAIPGDIPAERLVEAVDRRIEDHFSQWDRMLGQPRGGRGIDNPWKNNLGPVVDAFYQRESLRRELRTAIDHQKNLDEVNARLTEISGKIAKDVDFISEGRKMRPTLIQRSEREHKVTQLGGEVANLMTVVTEWPGTEAAIGAKSQTLVSVSEEIRHLEQEIADARKRASGEALRIAHKRLRKAAEDMETANQKLAESPSVDQDDLKQVKAADTEIRGLHVKIEAQKLLVELESARGTTVRIERGSEPPETITLQPGSPWKGEAPGRISVRADELRVMVKSGMEDVEALFSKLNEAEKRRDGLLELLGHPSLAAVEQAAERHKTCVHEVGLKEAAYRMALQDRTEEQWRTAIADLEALPSTRDLPVLEGLKGTADTQLATLNAEVGAARNKVDDWRASYTDIPTLMARVIAVKADLAQEQAALASLPALPEGFASVADYLNRLEALETAENELAEHRAQARQELAGLEAKVPARTAEEVRSELDLKERQFDRQVALGQALLRIQDTLNRVVAARGTEEPLRGLREAMERHFDRLTNGRYTGLVLEGTAPCRVKGEVALKPELLSQGTLGSLALAARLALAELYLKDDTGFLLLDDPFTDMDPDRRAAAAAALSDFAARYQVLVLTCHPAHRQELASAGGVAAALK